MTIEQASEHFGVPLDKLHLYENQGLFDCHKQPDGQIEWMLFAEMVRRDIKWRWHIFRQKT